MNASRFAGPNQHETRIDRCAMPLRALSFAVILPIADSHDLPSRD